jgi:hypothetical protein
VTRRRFGPALVAALLTWAVALAPISSIGSRPAAAAVSYTLTVKLSGTGSGWWKSTTSDYQQDGYIDCNLVNGVVASYPACTSEYPDLGTGYAKTYFSLGPAAGSCWVNASFVCVTSGLDSVVGFNNNAEVDHTFTRLYYSVTVTKNGGTGTGHISSSPGPIDCGATCTSPFLFDSTVTLTAVAATGSTFVSWTGGCVGQGSVCSLKVPLDGVSTNAVFAITATASPPRATPRATAIPRATATTPPGALPGASSAPNASATDVPTVTVLETGAPLASASSPPVDAAVATGSDSTPIVLAILGAGLLIAIGLGIVGFNLRRRPEGPPPS